jgi:hypothetical protein
VRVSMFRYVSSFLLACGEQVVVKSRCSSHVGDVDGLEMIRRCVAMVREKLSHVDLYVLVHLPAFNSVGTHKNT